MCCRSHEPIEECWVRQRAVCRNQSSSKWSLLNHQGTDNKTDKKHLEECFPFCQIARSHFEIYRLRDIAKSREIKISTNNDNDHPNRNEIACGKRDKCRTCKKFICQGIEERA